MPSYRMTFCCTARPLKRMSPNVPVPLFTVPGACRYSCDIWRPLIGRSFTSRSITLVPIRAELVSTRLAAADTVTVSLTPCGFSSRSMAELLAGEQLHAGVLRGREVRRFDAHRVERGPEPGDGVGPVGTRLGGAHVAGPLVVHDDFGAGDERAALVAHGADKAAVCLRPRDRGDDDNRGQNGRGEAAVDAHGHGQHSLQCGSGAHAGHAARVSIRWRGAATYGSCTALDATGRW